MKRLLFVSVLLLSALFAHAQRWSLGTNAVGYASLGTVNMEASLAVGRHVSIDVAGDLNPWTFSEGTPEQYQDRKAGGSLGVRWWPWHAYAGWWLRGDAQYRRYNRGGLVSVTAEEGEAYGAGLSFGYALMLNGWLNLDFGVGMWGGRKDYVVYACPSCGRIVEDGQKWFMAPDDLRISLSFIF